MSENNDTGRGTWFVACEDLFISSDGLLRIPHPRNNAEARLVCFPPAGAEAFMYDGWVPFLPESIELCAVQMPAEEHDVSRVIASLAESLLQHTRQGQKLFFIGLCLG